MFDPLGLCSPFTIRMRFLLKSIRAAMGKAWDTELSAEHSKLFSDWCSELIEIRTESINRLYFENGCTNLRLHIFTDASEEAMCIVAYLQDETTSETHLCYRKMPCGTYQKHDDSEVRTSTRSLRSSSQEADFERT